MRTSSHGPGKAGDGNALRRIEGSLAAPRSGLQLQTKRQLAPGLSSHARHTRSAAAPSGTIGQSIRWCGAPRVRLAATSSVAKNCRAEKWPERAAKATGSEERMGDILANQKAD